jgi:hypothetical protein
MFHRLRRLPDPPHKIARGVGVGVMVCFTPFYGMHFVLATLFSIILQGNILASILATFFGNPLTFPIIAWVSVEFGSWILGQPGGLSLPSIVGAFSYASLEIWSNMMAMFTDDVANWDRLGWFFRRVFWPYLVGGILPGIIFGLLAYSLSHRVIAAYQKSRIKRLKKRYQKRSELDIARAKMALKTK